MTTIRFAVHHLSPQEIVRLVGLANDVLTGKLQRDVLAQLLDAGCRASKGEEPNDKLPHIPDNLDRAEVERQTRRVNTALGHYRDNLRRDFLAAVVASLTRHWYTLVEAEAAAEGVTFD